MTQRIGYACKYLHHDQSITSKLLEQYQRPLNSRTTTVAWMNSRPEAEAVARVHEIVSHNLNAVKQQLIAMQFKPDALRMMRITSDLLPFYTHEKWQKLYTDDTFVRDIQVQFGKLGDLARKHDVRVSFHPGQFCVLASDNPNIVERSIAEFEYHADMLRWMGYGKTFQDAKCNIHLSGKGGAAVFRDSFSRLSPEAKNVITVENDEMSKGIDDVLEIADLCPIVLDIHHHFVHSKGEYILPSDERFAKVIASWRGVRPVIHYSVSREEYLSHFEPDQLPDFAVLESLGFGKQKLRAHSDGLPNTACNDWALSFLPYADIMVEAKLKNLASTNLYEHHMSKNA